MINNPKQISMSSLLYEIQILKDMERAYLSEYLHDDKALDSAILTWSTTKECQELDDLLDLHETLKNIKINFDGWAYQISVIEKKG